MRITILIASILISIISRGQVIKGEIKSSSNDTIPFAQIELISVANNETENATYADENGVFTLNFTESEQFYFLKISSLGFQTHSTDSFQKAPNFGTIILKPSDNSLDAIVIDVTKPVIEKTGRGLNVNIGASPLLENSNAKEILSKIPGVMMNQDGSLTLNGLNNVQVFINGKPTLLSLEQLVQQLEATPGSEIEKIEVFNTPPAKFDAAGTGGIINIIKKKSSSHGFNANLGLNAGMGKYPKANSWFNYNYRKGKFNLYGSLNAKRDQGFFDQRFTLLTTIDEEEHEIQNSKIPLMESQNLAGKIGLDYEVDSNTTIGLLISPYKGRFQMGEKMSAYIIKGDYDYQKNLGNRAMTNKWDGNIYNLNFKRKIKKGSWNFDTDYIYNYNGSDQVTKSDYWLDNNIIADEKYTTNWDIHLKAFTSKVDFEKELPKGWLLEVGAKYSNLNQHNNSYADFTDANNNWVNELDFNYDEQIGAAYASANKQFGKKWKADIGVRAEQTILDGKTQMDSIKFHQEFLNLFPNTSINYEASENWIHSWSYTSRIKRPEYQELTPFEQRLNPYLISIGNPNLRPQIVQQLSYGLGIYKHFNVSLNHSYKTNSLFLLPNVSEGEVIQRFQFKNLGEEYNSNITLNGPIKPSKKWLIQWNLTMFRKQLVNSPGFNFQFTSFHARIQNQFNFKKGWKAEFIGFYHHKHYWFVWYQDEFIQFDLAVSKKYKNWKFNFTGSDVFGLRIHKGGQIQGVLSSINLFEPEKQVFKLSVAYSFGNKKLKKQRERKTGAEDLQDRT